jgi:hypothetical protein
MIRYYFQIFLLLPCSFIGAMHPTYVRPVTTMTKEELDNYKEIEQFLVTRNLRGQWKSPDEALCGIEKELRYNEEKRKAIEKSPFLKQEENMFEEEMLVNAWRRDAYLSFKDEILKDKKQEPTEKKLVRPTKRSMASVINATGMLKLQPSTAYASSLVNNKNTHAKDLFSKFSMDIPMRGVPVVVPVFQNNPLEVPATMIAEADAVIISAEVKTVLKQHEIIAEYIKENKALKFIDRDALVANGDDKLHKALIKFLDDKYAEKIVRLKYPNLNDVEFYWAVQKEKELLLSLLRSSLN